MWQSHDFSFSVTNASLEVGVGGSPSPKLHVIRPASWLVSKGYLPSVSFKNHLQIVLTPSHINPLTINTSTIN
jgi:hypothetical protein